MKIIDCGSHDLLLEYIIGLGSSCLSDIDRKLENIETKSEWLELRKELLSVYRKAFPAEMFKKRTPVETKLVSRHDFKHYRIENVLFESFPGWYVNATVYMPLEDGKYPGIVCPTGHSSKKFANYTGSAQLLAQSGYIVVSFDPPGMQGEHREGNDHFEDGARGYLSGFWSQSFFLMDAIRCMDYLETRDDVIQGIGFGMTGVSGGGTTTIHTAVLDDRLTCIAPVCCVSDEEGVMFRDRYTFCPEGRGFGHIKGGIKYKSLLCLDAPVPCLLVAGRKEKVLRPEFAEGNVIASKKIYSFYEDTEIDIFVDPKAGHEYTPAMVCKVAAFFDKYLKGIEGKQQYSYDYNDLEHPEESQVLCYPGDKTSMYTMNLKRFSNSERKTVPGPEKLASMLEMESFSDNLKMKIKEEPKIRWVHRLEKRIYDLEDGRMIPALLLERDSKVPDNLLFYADDRDKWTEMENDGFLTQLTNFLDRTVKPGEYSVLSADLSGFGELSMAPGEYDLSSWSRTDRLLSYIAISLGSSILQFRTEEYLRILKDETNRGKYRKIIAAGRGNAALAVLLAAYISKDCDRVVLSGLPVSFFEIAKTVPNDFCPVSIIHNAPDKFEIYEIVNQMKNITIVNPVHADGTVLTKKEADGIYRENVKVVLNDHGLDKEIFKI